MDTTVNLRRLFDFSQLPIIITGAVLAVLTVAIILMFLYTILKNMELKQKEAEEVMVEPGDQCRNPYECWYYDYCHGQAKEPEQMSLL